MCLGDGSFLKAPLCTAVVVNLMDDTMYCVLFKLVILLALEVTGFHKSVCLQYAMLLRMEAQHDFALLAIAVLSFHLTVVEVAGVDVHTLLKISEAKIPCRRQRQCARNCNLSGGKMMINDVRSRPRLCTYRNIQYINE